MYFSRADVSGFAAWSRDHNPLHVDPAFGRGTFFGRSIVHGMCSVVHALAESGTTAQAARSVDIEFLGAMGLEASCPVTASRDGQTTLVTVADPSGAPVLRLKALPDDAAAGFGALVAWLSGAPSADTVLSRPADRSLDDIQRLADYTGRYATLGAPPPALEGSAVAPLHAQVYALCSYVVGMEVPGLRSLFTRAVIRFGAEVEAHAELLYRVSIERVDPAFRLLDTRIEVAAADGRLLATCQLRSYVRFSPVAIDLGLLRAQVADQAAVRGKVALVIGGSRGLGADMASALALAGARVFVSYHHDEAGAQSLRERLAGVGCEIEALKGDAGDAEWCAAAIAHVTAQAGGLDVLVLNACGAPTPLAIGPDSAGQFGRYLQENFALVQAPLAAALPPLRARGGVVAYVSSSYVAEHPARFGHYVALKQASEALVETVVREAPMLAGLVLRPPPLQTAWNDTPTGALGTIASDRVAVALVRAVADASPGAARVVAEFPPHAVTDAPSDLQPLPIALVASFTADPIEKALHFWGRELGLEPSVSFSPYGQVLQALFDPGSRLSTNSAGLNVVLLRVQDWLRELPDDRRGDVSFVREHVGSASRDLVEAMRGHRARARAATLLILCPASAAVTATPVGAVLREVEDRLVAELSGLPGLQVGRAAAHHEQYEVDVEGIDDPLRDKIGHIPYTDAYYHVLGTVVLRHAWQRIAAPLKVVVVDCDNTLWRGVVGEVGAEGIEFGPEHLLLQDRLVDLSANGVVVCLCSKNVEDDVWRVFDTRPDMHLKREHVVAAMVNWRRKSENIRELAATLNLGLDSFVFLDDNHVECGEVRAGCPEVLTLEWPHDEAAARRLLAHLWELDIQGATAEDRKRTQMYREEFGRQSLRQGVGSFRDFLASLDLVVEVDPLTDADLARASQLTMRTNQFNFTTIRRDEAEVRALLETGRHDIRTVRVRDRFGDYGLVGLLIAERGDEALKADTFLMSCRVLGRGAEHRMMAELGRIAQGYGLPAVHLRLEPTKRNAPARNFLETLAPEEIRGGAGVLDFTVPSDALATLEYQPDDAEPEPVVDEATPAKAAPAAATADAQVGDRQRKREAQVARAMSSLATEAALSVAIDGRAASAVPGAAVAVSREQVASTVLEAFSQSLGLPTAEIAAVDGLEALGCTSFRIVEITVTLMQSFPWLPSTLLFEHRGVGAIVDHIARLADQRLQAPAPSVRPAPVVSEARRATTRDVAVVGLDLRCAGARSADELWQLLSAGDVAVRPVPTRRRYFSGPLEDGRPHWAGLLDDVDRFDAAFFGISPREADLMDPQLRLFLQVAWGALEDANAVAGGVEADTGVFAGLMYDDYAHHANRLTRAAASPYKSWESFSLANRLSQVLGLRGPSLVVDTACSSSGTALHLACRALLDGDCRQAVVGGVNLILDPDRFAQLGRLGILSGTGRCLAFGKDADGTVLGEGIGVVVLRRLDDALERGDRIYGVIKGTGVSTGSGTVGFTAPNPQAQAVAIRRAVDVSGIDPATISYVETHGTATLLGDPIEVRGLTLGYGVEEGRGPVRAGIGSIKPNIGHLEAGAAVLSLIKVLLQLHHRTLLPSVSSEEPNPQIPFAQLPFVVQRHLAPWETDGQPRRAAVSSFGVGGANVHVIVEEAPAPTARSAATTLTPRTRHLVTLSARSQASLQGQARALADALEGEAGTIADVAHTLNVTRRVFEERAAIVAVDVEALRSSLRALAKGEADAATQRRSATGAAVPRVAFLFTGQGAQYAGMGRELYGSQPVFREAIDACAVHLDDLLGVSLVELLHGEETDATRGRLDQTRFTQPALFAVEYALARLWQSWGVEPAMVVGHSVGEFAAMCIAGGLSLAAAARLVAARGRLMQELPAGGVMVSVAAGEDRVRAALAGDEDRVAVAGVNAPQQTVISGEQAAVAAVVETLSAEGVRTRALTVSHAFHSPLMRPMLSAFDAELQSVTWHAPTVPIVACADGVPGDQVMATPVYWSRQILEPVRFVQAMEVLRAAGITAFVEIGPHPVLTSLGRQCLGAAASDALWLPSMAREAEEWATLLAAAGALHLAGQPLDWAAVEAPERPSIASVPHYAFDARPYWVAPPSSGSAAAAPVSRRLAEVATYAVEWQPIDSPRGPGGSSGTWIVLAASDPASAGIAAALERAGDRCVVVEPDAPATKADIGALLEAQAPVRGVVHLRALDAPASGVMSVAALDAWRARVLDSALAAAQAVAGHEGARLHIVTRAAVPAEPTDVLSLPASVLWGFGRTVALEDPSHWGGLVDVPGGPVTPGDIAVAVDAVRASWDEDQVAVREGRLLAARLAKADVSRQGRMRMRPDATYLVTGGMGALGVQVAAWLADRGARHLVLAGRQVRESAAVEALRRRGVSVELAAVDVGEAAQVEALLARTCSGPVPLKGIVHAAGVDTQCALGELTPDDLTAALSSKMVGAWLLHDRTREIDLDWFVTFSSLASVLGATGRAPYAAANAFLDALAHERVRLGLPALSINWGPWAGAGMAAEG
ncbi:SDR family NAD(P)-dependent oxidoreductase, partial [Luteitalea sp.]|uniref:SDR family NAD(P)-dependent oxidoreductase n=1 Tax=Luteitalea sp. TaxID=2004800 RepID=UPI0037C973A6